MGLGTGFSGLAIVSFLILGLVAEEEREWESYPLPPGSPPLPLLGNVLDVDKNKLWKFRENIRCLPSNTSSFVQS